MENEMKLVTMWYDHVGQAGEEFRKRIEGLIKAGTLKEAPFTPESVNNKRHGRVQVVGDPKACQVIEGVSILEWRDL